MNARSHPATEQGSKAVIALGNLARKRLFDSMLDMDLSKLILDQA
jgi:hypothetical protein